MFPAKVPRVFVVASIILSFLVTYTTLHLYHRVPPSYPATNSQVASIADAVTLGQRPGPGHGSNTAQTATTTVLPTVLASPAPRPTSGKGEPDRKPGAGEKPPTPPVLPGYYSNVAGGTSEEEQQMPLPDPRHCPEDLRFLVRSSIDLELTERVRYTRRYIQPVFSKSTIRDDVVNITEPLVKGDVEVDLYDCSDVTIPTSAPIKLHVPNPYPDAAFAHLVFGVATDFHRLNDSIRPFSHWMSDTGAKLVAVVTDAKDKKAEEMDKLARAFEVAGINATLVRPINDTFTTSQNHFTVLVSMLEHASPEAQWFGLLDDDTFFPSLKPLSDSLAKLDHETDAYVGALSEDFAAVRTFGFMAFGGAGAFLSAPLARKLGDQALKCIDEATSKEGDIIIRDCVYTNSKAKLTILPGLYQQDMREDVSGFFEAGLRPLNLHHWKSWYKEPVEKMAAAVKLCGDCFLQRWRFGTDTVLSNGFSIVMYPDGLDSVDLQSMEGTWNKAGKDYDFSIGPLRKALPADKKRSYKLRAAEFGENGDFQQLYLRVGDAARGELDEVVELVWRRH
ncbi:glycosyltransferase family 31 protein [Durotheca rogersii]|uniref:glycosyltransferase family 31 protein n=1 Tax=Durotheca rogersii TaxID=419775 RepID=UPI0022209AC1|nr:glycosyltransferase family 31 protein [Durotheca rogersii]KAI5859579.1 glycosyltransferase family 31 protein [Durotheca rogersii]